MPTGIHRCTGAKGVAVLLAGTAWAACLSGCVPVPSLAEDGEDDRDASTISDAMVEPIDGAPPPDGPGVGTPDAGRCEDLLPFVPSNFTACGAVNDPIALTRNNPPYRLDTDTGVLSGDDVNITLASVVVEQQGGPDILVIATSSFELGPNAVLGVDGSRALALVSTGDITIGGLMTAGAVGIESGPGGDNQEACETARGGNGSPQGGGGSGGGGGGFAAVGGTGAPVDGVSGAGPTRAGVASGDASLVPLRGGCAGGNGGLAVPGSGTGGGGGGALQLVAGGTLIVQDAGTLTARGGGGLGVHGVGLDGIGGGGGGSGGGLLLEAMAIATQGAITANGGGGGEGSHVSDSTEDGENGPDRGTSAALGGNSGSNGGNGGTGGVTSAVAGGNGFIGLSSGTDFAGGGGGGGSRGRTRLRAIGSLDMTGGLFFPSASIAAIEP